MNSGNGKFSMPWSSKQVNPNHMPLWRWISNKQTLFYFCLISSWSFYMREMDLLPLIWVSNVFPMSIICLLTLLIFFNVVKYSKTFLKKKKPTTLLIQFMKIQNCTVMIRVPFVWVLYFSTRKEIKNIYH